jgi:hypothetical protein
MFEYGFIPSATRALAWSCELSSRGSKYDIACQRTDAAIANVRTISTACKLCLATIQNSLIVQLRENDFEWRNPFVMSAVLLRELHFYTIKFFA